MEWCFLVPVTGLLYAGIVLGAGITAQRAWDLVLRAVGRQTARSRVPTTALTIAGRVAGLAGAGVAIAMLLRVTEAGNKAAREKVIDGQESIALLARYCDPKDVYDWARVGKIYNEVLPADARIATTRRAPFPSSATATR